MDPDRGELSFECPSCRAPLTGRDSLVCDNGHSYPVVDGIPVLLPREVAPTIGIARESVERAVNGRADARAPELYLESLGISEDEKAGVVELARRGSAMDPVVAFLIGATNGHMYKHLIGSLREYPIPDLRLPPGEGRRFLDVGCNWGRWCIAAARKGYRAIGIDPSLGAVMAARRVSHSLGLDIDYVVGDARFLPLPRRCMDQVFSYSVLQHFSKTDARQALREAGRVLRSGGRTLIQMPNALGPRSLQHQLRRRLRAPTDFEVRYWTLPELRSAFEQDIGPSSISTDCFFGLGIQASDRELMPPLKRAIVDASELLRRASKLAPALTYVADSVYVASVKAGDD